MRCRYWCIFTTASRRQTTARPQCAPPCGGQSRLAGTQTRAAMSCPRYRTALLHGEAPQATKTAYSAPRPERLLTGVFHEIRENWLLRKLRRRQPGQRMYSSDGYRTDSTALARCTIVVFLHEPGRCEDTPQHHGFSLGGRRQDLRREGV